MYKEAKEKPCEQCWETFKYVSRGRKYCSQYCKKKAEKLRERKRAKDAIIEGESNQYLKMRFMVLRRDNFTCQYCGRDVTDGSKLEVDHILPKKRKGKFSFDNLITACRECNQGKKDVLLTKREIEKLKN